MKLQLFSFLLAAGIAVRGHGALLVHLPFDNNGTDTSGQNHQAVANNGAGFDVVNFKLGEAAASFNGSNYFNIPNWSPVVGNGPRSVGFWEHSTAAALLPNMTFLGWGEPEYFPGIRFDVCLENDDNTRLRCEFNLNAVVSTTNNVNFCDGTWHHIVVTYDATNIRFYADGKAYGLALTPAQKLETGGRVTGMVIGAGVWALKNGMETHRRFFTGQMDDVGVWNSAITAADVALINGLGRIGNNDLRWLEAAHYLWSRPLGSTAMINGHTWMKVRRLPGVMGFWRRVGDPNGTSSFIVLDDSGDGIQIVFPWWEHGWVKEVGALAGLLALVGAMAWFVDRVRLRLYQRRLALQEAKENERRRIAQDLHDDLGSGLTEIIQLGDLAAQECRSQEDLRGRMEIITGKTRAIVAAVDEIVWTMNPRNDTLPRLAGYLSDHAQEFFRATPVRCRFDVMGGLPAIPIGASARHHLFLAFKETLNNVIKHSAANEVWVRIHFADGVLKLTVEDDGCGFDVEAASSRNGLINMQNRFQEIGGSVEIRSRAGTGTTIEFALPLQKNETS